MMSFLSKGVVVPPEHVATRIVPTTAIPGGPVHDWTQVTSGFFRVCSGPKRPKRAEVAVHYRGYWFWIAESDVQSRATLAMLEILLSLQESERSQLGPLLTLPIN
jgi:hypothetical protein